MDTINLIDSLTEEDSISNTTEDTNYCDHKFLLDDVRNEFICINCGITKDTDEFNNNSDINNPIEINQISVKGLGIKMKNFYLWQSASNYCYIAFNKDLDTIKSICDKVGLNGMISDDAKLIYRKYKEIIGFNTTKMIYKPNTKKQKIKIIEQFKTDNNTSINNQMIISTCKVRGDTKKGLLCACIYYACFKNNKCILCSTLSEAINIRSKCVHKGCDILLQIREMDDKDIKVLIPIVCLPYPIDYMDNVCYVFEKYTKCNITDKMRNEIKVCMLNSQNNNILVNHNSNSFAICIVFIYLVEHRVIKANYSKKLIADWFGICQPTINTTCKELIKNHSKIFEDSNDNTNDKCDDNTNDKCEVSEKQMKEFIKGIECNNINLDLNIIHSLM